MKFSRLFHEAAQGDSRQSWTLAVSVSLEIAPVRRPELRFRVSQGWLPPFETSIGGRLQRLLRQGDPMLVGYARTHDRADALVEHQQQELIRQDAKSALSSKCRLWPRGLSWKLLSTSSARETC